MNQRHALREAKLERMRAVQEKLKAHNEKKRDAKLRGLVQAQLSMRPLRSESAVPLLHPRQVATLARPHPAMEAAGNDNAHVKSALGRLLAWAETFAPKVVVDHRAGLLVLARLHAQWLRPVELARPAGKSSAARLLNLVRFLLEKYPAPRPLLRAFLRPVAEPTGWYPLVAQGTSLRQVVATAGFTKRAAHLYPRAPKGYRVIQALRWAQVRALGGDESLAKVVAEKSCIQNVRGGTREVFWHHWLAWLVAHPEFPLKRVEELSYYVSGKIGAGEAFTMKGRTAAKLVQTLDARLAESKKRAARVFETFRPCGLPGASFVSGAGTAGFERRWRLAEILDSEALYQEGKAMRHCVATYGEYIREGDTAIFSLCRSHLGETKRALTVEVEFEKGGRFFGEVRGKCNRDPTAEERDIVKRWGKKVGVRFRA